MSAATHISHDFDCSFESTIETLDHQDHTFNGMYFELSVNPDDLPLAFVKLNGISVRGALGQMTVWITPNGLGGGATSSSGGHPWSSLSKLRNQNEWRLLYTNHVPSSFRHAVSLTFDEPVVLEPGQKVGLYVHSARHADDGIVYDNQRGRQEHTYRDDVISVHPGYAHLCHTPFGTYAPWGGTAWRARRAFVGGISYGARFLLWTPDVHTKFPDEFRKSCEAMHLVHATSWDGLPAEVVLYILNFCPANWFEHDAPKGTKGTGMMPTFLKKKLTSRSQQQQQQQSVTAETATTGSCNGGTGCTATLAEGVQQQQQETSCTSAAVAASRTTTAGGTTTAAPAALVPTNAEPSNQLTTTNERDVLCSCVVS